MNSMTICLGVAMNAAKASHHGCYGLTDACMTRLKITYSSCGRCTAMDSSLSNGLASNTGVCI